MPVCNDPSNSGELVQGTKYEVYPKVEDGDELLFEGWFVTKQQNNEEGEESVIAIFRTDRAQQPGEALGNPNLYEVVPLWGDGGDREGARYRYCEVGGIVQGMANLNLNDANMAVEDGGRRRLKTRASRRTSLGRLARSRSRRKPRRVKSRRQQRK